MGDGIIRFRSEKKKEKGRKRLPAVWTPFRSDEVWFPVCSCLAATIASREFGLGCNVFFY
jgi:hypothetical protein